MERLDFETLFRIVRWDYNRCFKDESLDKDLFMGKYGKVMGDELSKSGDSIKRKHVHELKRIFQILLDHQGLKVLGTVNVIVDEVCGEGTWIKYSERSERWRKGEEERERIKLERLRKEEEARYKDFDEKLEEWKSGEINFLNTPFYIPGEKPNAWIRIKGNIIETSKQIKIGIAEARKLWRAVSAMHRGAEFRHGLVEDVTGH